MKTTTLSFCTASAKDSLFHWLAYAREARNASLGRVSSVGLNNLLARLLTPKSLRQIGRIISEQQRLLLQHRRLSSDNFAHLSAGINTKLAYVPLLSSYAIFSTPSLTSFCVKNSIQGELFKTRGRNMLQATVRF